MDLLDHIDWSDFPLRSDHVEVQLISVDLTKNPNDKKLSHRRMSFIPMSSMIQQSFQSDLEF